MSARKFYIVRLRADDSIVAVGSTEECAKAMGMSVSSFHATVCRSRKGQNHKYEIDVELEDRDEQVD